MHEVQVEEFMSQLEEDAEGVATQRKVMNDIGAILERLPVILSDQLQIQELRLIVEGLAKQAQQDHIMLHQLADDLAALKAQPH